MLRMGCPAPKAVLAWEVSLAPEIILVTLLLLKMLVFKECLMAVVFLKHRCDEWISLSYLISGLEVLFCLQGH